MTSKSRFFRVFDFSVFFFKKDKTQKAPSGGGERRFLLNKYRFSHSRSTKKRFLEPIWGVESALRFLNGGRPDLKILIFRVFFFWGGAKTS